MRMVSVELPGVSARLTGVCEGELPSQSSSCESRVTIGKSSVLALSTTVADLAGTGLASIDSGAFDLHEIAIRSAGHAHVVRHSGKL